VFEKRKNYLIRMLEMVSKLRSDAMFKIPTDAPDTAPRRKLLFTRTPEARPLAGPFAADQEASATLRRTMMK